MSVTYEMFQRRNPEYQGHRWRTVRALARGNGPLEDRDVLCHLLPKREGEPQSVYDMRLNSAYHVPYLGRLVGQVVSSLGTDPLSVRLEEEAGDASGSIGGPAAWYHTFSSDVSAPDGQRQGLDEFMGQQARTAILCGRSWTLVDLPEAAESPRNLADERLAGSLDAYLCVVDPEDVVDWEWDDDSEALLYAICRTVRVPRRSFTDSRDTVEETFTVYGQEDWSRFVYVYKINEPPTVDSPPTQTFSGPHSFGRVPLVPFELPEDLQIGRALESTAIELFRKMNGLSWSEDRGLFAQLVETSDPDPKAMLSKEIGGTPSLEAQSAGPGTVLRAQPGSKLEYLAPPEHVYKVAEAKCIHLRDEMYRIANQMALAANSTGAALGRSAESKGLDMQALSVMLGEIGRHIREHADRVLETVAEGRGDDLPVKSAGMQEFELVDTDRLVTEARSVIGDGKTVQIKSKTFLAGYSYEVARQLWPAARREELAQVRQELSEASEEVTPGDQEDLPLGQDEGSEQDGGDADGGPYAMLQEDFPPEAIAWVKEAQWEGPKPVPLAQLDFSNVKEWRASKEPKKVAQFVEKMRKLGFWKPIVLVRMAGQGKYRITDGHHRALAARKLRRPVVAYVTELSGEAYDAALGMHASQKNAPSGPEGKNDKGI